MPGRRERYQLSWIRDTVVEYEITSNRVDCFSILGIAREAAATFGKEFVPPVVTETGNNEDVNDYIKVSVKDESSVPVTPQGW